MLSYSELFSILNSNSSFLITTHVNPDADAIGSEIALAGILDQLQKEYIIINHSETPYNIQFLDPDNIIQKFDPSIHASLFNKVEVAIFLDLNFLNRTVKMEKYFREFKGKRFVLTIIQTRKALQSLILLIRQNQQLVKYFLILFLK